MAETIIALATAPIKSALSLIRVSGSSSFAITRSVFSKPEKIDGSRKMVFGEIVRDGKTLDQVMLYLYPAAHSMTGEDVVEISCHGSMVIVTEIIDLFISLGAKYAERGEFTERAFLNGKMNLVEAEAVNELINAKTKEGKDLALLSLKGESSFLLVPIKKELGDLLSLIEVNIDYPEYEDIEIANESKIVQSCSKIQKDIAKLIQNGNVGRAIKEGVSVSLVGVPNVGKSSLLNALINEDKAIVSSIPGTTRDLVEGSFEISGVPFFLTDTAGLRETDNEIERIGVQKSEEALRKSELVLLVLDAKRPVLPQRIEAATEGKEVLKVYNKSDTVNERLYTDGIYVSALNGDVKALKEAMLKRIGVSEESFGAPSLSNARQIALLKQVSSLLDEAAKEAKLGYPMDLISVSLHRAFNAIKEILGEEVSQDISDEIFSRFCLGK